MNEIIIAVIIYLSTILGGVPAEKKQSDTSETSKSKKEQPINGSGGTGTWGDT